MEMKKIACTLLVLAASASAVLASEAPAAAPGLAASGPAAAGPALASGTTAAAPLMGLVGASLISVVAFCLQ
ncbi:hypothetical protein H6P81_009468 [Aristolochia fimbriata]|uniref:Arabinogalactan peptide 23-like n=1 Tax=Aristolochia fimbriata TaxID=158543 RepID=A0AAV7EL51_ARIFI|nr:hypothetical protein H6P81_009468 [Aristolochia fimbriata]